MILLTPRPSSCVPGTGSQFFNRCFPSKHHAEDGPRFSSSVAWRVSSSSSRTGSLMSSCLCTRICLQPCSNTFDFGRLFVYPPARTKRKVTPPTPELAETTASSIPSPTCAFDVTSGDCGATHNCITSPKYSENHAPDGSCVIKLASLLTLDEKDFRTEVLWDTVVMN